MGQLQALTICHQITCWLSAFIANFWAQLTSIHLNSFEKTTVSHLNDTLSPVAVMVYIH